MTHRLDTLFASFFPSCEIATYLRIDGALSTSELECRPLQDFADAAGDVWYPAGALEQIKSAYSIRSVSKPLNTTLVLWPVKRGHIQLVIRGQNNCFFSLTDEPCNFSARIVDGSKLLIGEACSLRGGSIFTANSDVLIGASGLWSDEVIIQSSDQHGIVDLQTRNIINGDRSHVTIGRHVWLGRRSMIGKNVSIGDGSIVGHSSVVTKNVPRSSIVVGNPARVIRTNVSWCDGMNPIGNDALEIDSLLEPDIPNIHGRRA